MKFLPAFLLLACSTSFCFAGNLPDTARADADTLGARQLLFSVDYLSDKTYLGRENIVSDKYVATALSYVAPSGFFSSLSAYKIVSSENKFDEADITAGWDFRIFNSLETMLSYSHFFFSRNSSQPRSTLRNNFEASFMKEYRWFTPAMYFDMNFGRAAKPDFSIRFEISRDFEFDSLFTKGNDALIISPNASIAAATLNFYSAFLRDSTQGRTIQNIGVNVNSNFQLASIDLALPVEYNIGKFMLRPEIRHTIPLGDNSKSDNKEVTYFIFSVGYFLIDK